MGDIRQGRPACFGSEQLHLAVQRRQVERSVEIIGLGPAQRDHCAPVVGTCVLFVNKTALGEFFPLFDGGRGLVLLRSRLVNIQSDFHRRGLDRRRRSRSLTRRAECELDLDILLGVARRRAFDIKGDLGVDLRVRKCFGGYLVSALGGIEEFQFGWRDRERPASPSHILVGEKLDALALWRCMVLFHQNDNGRLRRNDRRHHLLFLRRFLGGRRRRRRLVAPRLFRRTCPAPAEFFRIRFQQHLQPTGPKEARRSGPESPTRKAAGS